MTARSRGPRLDADEAAALLATLEARFEASPYRRDPLSWAEVRARLDDRPEKLWCLGEMERTGGEPDVIGRDETTGEYLFCDCSAESPAGRRSACYDDEALRSRKKYKPDHSAVGLATAMGAELMGEEEYLDLQARGEFDTKTSSWLRTPVEIRDRGGAIFGDRRFGRVFVYHNGAESYYAGRGFRCLLRV